MKRSFLQRVLAPIVDIRPHEIRTALLMFAYAFLAMTAYNIIQPLTRSKLIASLGSRNVPYVLLVSSVIIGVVMLGYTRLVSLFPRRWALPIVQGGMALVMIGFWAVSKTGSDWVSVAFYLWGLILGILLISQFWTLANSVYDPRQAKRLFGFIGGGVSLGGATGAGLTALLITNLGTATLLLCSAAVLIACMALVSVILHGPTVTVDVSAAGKEEKGVSVRRALELIRSSRQIQLIAMVIAFGSLGAALIDQQVNMAAELFKGGGGEDAMGQFLAQIRVYLSIAGFVIQVWLTPRIHRYLGVGFALMMLPVGLGVTAAVTLLLATLWAPAVATIFDRSVRYTVDKTTREVLFLPLPRELRQEVKPFVDVTVDRLSRGVGALLLLVLVQSWGLALQWYQLSFVSLALAAIWIRMAAVAKREYLASFRRSIERKEMAPAELRLDVADLSTIETLLEELASPDERRVVYAIDILESLEKRHLITPLLLYHSSVAVRRRALEALGRVRPEVAERWLPSIQRMMSDESADVRAAAVVALANIRNEQVTEMIRPLLTDRDSRIATTAAVVLARSGREADVSAAEEVLSRLTNDLRPSAAAARRDVAAAAGQLTDARFRQLLIPLLYDPDRLVAEEAISTVRRLGTSEFLFVPSLVSLLRHRSLKGPARDVLVGYGEGVLDILAHFLRDSEEDIWVRRHVPSTIARIPSQKSMDILIAALDEPDGFLRYKVVAAMEKLHRERADLTISAEPIEKLAVKEATHYFNYLTLHFNLFHKAALPDDALLARALQEKLMRTSDRVYRLLGLMYPWQDIAAARWAIERGEPRSRASALEYLDNMLKGATRKRLMPLLEDLPIEEKVRRANALLRTRARDVEETLLRLINDDDPVVSAVAIDFVEERTLWGLANDLEHVLANRDVKDWYVFEAASWALAAYRLPEKRQSLWLEPLPIVQLAARLRRIPLFASVSVDELFRMAGAGRQLRHETGTTLFVEGAVPASVQLLLDGSVTMSTRGGESQELVPPAALGFEQALEERAMPATIRTNEISVSLALSSDELKRLLADNTDLVQGLFRMLASQLLAREPLLNRTSAVAEVSSLPHQPLRPVEKALVLEQIPLFSGISADESLQLASIVREVPLTLGATLFAEGEPAAMYVILSGRISLEPPRSEAVTFADVGDIIGLYTTLAGGPFASRAVVTASGRALRIEREDLFDLLGQRQALLQHVFGALFRAPITEKAAA